MFTLLAFLAGLAGGAVGSTAWLLSEPDSSDSITDAQSLAPETLQARLQLLKTRLSEAWAEGQREGKAAEERLRRELGAYRHEPAPPVR